MAVILGVEIGKRVLQAINVDSPLVTNIEISVPANDVVRVKIERIVSYEEAERIIEILQAVEWKKAEQE